jgi:hypothetical protein
MKDKKKWRKKVLAFALAMLTFTGIFFENSVMTQAENKEEKQKITSKYIICFMTDRKKMFFPILW